MDIQPAPAAPRRARATLAADAYDELRSAIMLGELRPGAPLRLEELARMLGMSISPVREAVRLLEVQGLAEYAPYRGARVTELSAEEMREIYEIRAALERVAVRRAATSFTPANRAALDDALGQLELAYAQANKIAIVRANSLFHARIAEASDSQWLQRLLSPLLEMSERYAAAVLEFDEGETDGTRAIEARGHRAIMDGLEHRDPGAAEAALIEHLEVFSRVFSVELGSVGPAVA